MKKLRLMFCILPLLLLAGCLQGKYSSITHDTSTLRQEIPAGTYHNGKTGTNKKNIWIHKLANGTYLYQEKKSSMGDILELHATEYRHVFVGIKTQIGMSLSSFTVVRWFPNEEMILYYKSIPYSDSEISHLGAILYPFDKEKPIRPLPFAKAETNMDFMQFLANKVAESPNIGERHKYYSDE